MPALTTKQVMALLSIRDPDTVYRLGRDGKIRGNQLRRVWRWDEDSVNEFLRGGPAAPAPAPAPPPRRPVALNLPPVRDRIGERRARRSAPSA